MAVNGIVYRIPKGSALTAAEMDNNLLLLANAVGDLQDSVNDGYKVHIGSDEPSAEDRDNTIWFRIDSGTGDIDRYYWYDSGLAKWICKHEKDPSGKERVLWVGNTTELQTYDGGDGNTLGDASGPFWEVDTAFEARFPLGVGTLPSTTAVAALGTGGVEEVELTTAEVPLEHYHGTGRRAAGDPIDTGNNDFEFIMRQWTKTGTYHYNSLQGDTSLSGNGDFSNTGTAATTGAIEDSPSADPHTNMPPYIGTYFIKRTSRKYRTAP